MNKTKKIGVFFSFCFLLLSLPNAVRSAEIGAIYKYCSEYKNAGFEVKSQNALVCAVAMTAVLGTKKNECVGFTAQYQRAKDNKTKKLLSDMGHYHAVGPKTLLAPFILAFLSWAEKNPDLWEDNAYLRSNEWSTENMRCVVENPFGE